MMLKELLSLNGNKAAMISCLNYWKTSDPFKATYKVLLEIILELERGDIANGICFYLSSKKSKSTLMHDMKMFLIHTQLS